MLYVADGEGGLKRIDISDSLHPTLVQSVETPSLARDLAVTNGRVYVAQGGHGVAVYDLTTPTNYEGKNVLAYGLQPHEPPQLVADFVQQTGITYPVKSSQGTLGLFDFAPGVGYPHHRDIVIGKDLTVPSIKSSFHVTEMDNLIQQLLAE